MTRSFWSFITDYQVHKMIDCSQTQHLKFATIEI